MKKYLNVLSIIFAALLFLGASCFSVGGQKEIKTSGPAGIFVSTDKGDSWKQLSALPTEEGIKNIAGVSVYRLAEDPLDPKALYIASRGQGMFFTYDNGQTWQQPETVMNEGFVYSVAVHPQNKCIIYASNGQLVYRTEDCSRTWKEVYRESRADARVESLAFDNFQIGTIYLAISSGDLLSSSDKGNNWQIIKRFKTRLAHVVPSPLQLGLIYVISREKGLYRSEDYGVNWESLSEGLKEFSGALTYRRHLLHPTNPDQIYWISTYGILVSKDKGDNWEAMNLITPPGSANIYAFAVNPQNDEEIYYTATIENRSTFYRTNDGGESWVTKKLPSGQIPTVLRVHPENEEWVYLGFTIPPSK